MSHWVDAVLPSKTRRRLFYALWETNPLATQNKEEALSMNVCISAYLHIHTYIHTKVIIYIIYIYIYMLPPPPSDLPFLGLFRPLNKKQQRRPKSRVVNHRVMKDSYWDTHLTDPDKPALEESTF